MSLWQQEHTAELPHITADPEAVRGWNPELEYSLQRLFQ